MSAYLDNALQRMASGYRIAYRPLDNKPWHVIGEGYHRAWFFEKGALNDYKCQIEAGQSSLPNKGEYNGRPRKEV